MLPLDRSALQWRLTGLHLRHASDLLHEARRECRAPSLHLKLGLDIDS